MRRQGINRLLLGAALMLTPLLAPTSALAQETINYTYDARGRVVNTTRAGGPVQGAVTTYTYDKADNRTNVTVASSPKGSQPDTGGGATANTRRLVVVPLNGLSVIMLGI